MNHLKKFLKSLSESGVYYSEMEDKNAFIYVADDSTPAVLLEVKDNFYQINIRCDIPPHLVANIIHDMTVLDSDIIIGPDFFVTQDGILYGQDATAMFFATVYQTMEITKLRQEIELNDFVYVVQQPIYGYETRDKKTKYNKMQRLWGIDEQ